MAREPAQTAACAIEPIDSSSLTLTTTTITILLTKATKNQDRNHAHHSDHVVSMPNTRPSKQLSSSNSSPTSPPSQLCLFKPDYALSFLVAGPSQISPTTWFLAQWSGICWRKDGREEEEARSCNCKGRYICGMIWFTIQVLSVCEDYAEWTLRSPGGAINQSLLCPIDHGSR